MEIKHNTLENDFNAWSLVTPEPWMSVLPSMWAFHLKHFPDGLSKKLKAWFCVHGDFQFKGMDYFETWLPVIQWIMVHTMMVLSTKLELQSAQAHITAAFVHTPFETPSYVQQPAGFQREGEFILKLNKSVFVSLHGISLPTLHVSKNKAVSNPTWILVSLLAIP